jgi:hypothetical protein
MSSSCSWTRLKTVARRLAELLVPSYSRTAGRDRLVAPKPAVRRSLTAGTMKVEDYGAGEAGAPGHPAGDGM